MKRSGWTWSRTWVLFSTVLCASLLCACDDEDPPSGAPSDAATDTAVDVGTDSPPPADAGKDVVSDGPVEASPDAPVDVQTDTPQDVQPDTPTGTAFLLFVTESPPGPGNQNPATWRGVQRHSLTGSGAEMIAGTSIDKDAVADPAGLAYSETLSEVFVGNRHGNVAADGTAGSISRFRYDKGTQALTPNGTITGNGLAFTNWCSTQLPATCLPRTTREAFPASRSGLGEKRFLMEPFPMECPLVSPCLPTVRNST